MKYKKKIFLNANVKILEQLDQIYFYIMTVNGIQIFQINKNKIILDLSKK